MPPDLTMRETQQPSLPIAALITERMKELGLTRTEVVRRATHIRNVSKGLRRLDDLLAGNFSRTAGLLEALPTALEVRADVVAKAVEDTKRHFLEAEEAAYRASFVPHAIIVTERSIPWPVHIAAVLGIERLLRVDFDPLSDPATFVEQGLRGLREKTERDGTVPTFGNAVGLVVNYSPDCAEQFDLNGQSVGRLEAARRLGASSFSLKGRSSPLAPDDLAALFGGR